MLFIRACMHSPTHTSDLGAVACLRCGCPQYIFLCWPCPMRHSSHACTHSQGKVSLASLSSIQHVHSCLCPHSNHIRKNLQHPNEYVRGFTLRFMSKVKQLELLQELAGPIKENLNDAKSYVRRSCFLAAYPPSLLRSSPLRPCLFPHPCRSVSAQKRCHVRALCVQGQSPSHPRRSRAD